LRLFPPLSQFSLQISQKQVYLLDKRKGYLLVLRRVYKCLEEDALNLLVDVASKGETIFA
jgi:hypothetical protein